MMVNSPKLAFFLCALLALILIPRDGFAYPAYRRYLKQVYPGRTARCEACHKRGGGTERNEYGEQWARKGGDLPAFKALDNEDSDGDGITNRVELEQDSNPGDRKSTPADPGRYRASSPDLAIPTEQLLLVWRKAERVEAAEVDLTDAQVATIQKATQQQQQRALDVADRFATLYFGVEQGQRSKVALFVHVNLPERAESGVSGRTAILIGVDLHTSRVTRAITFADTTAVKYRALFECLEGHTKEDLPPPTDARCGGGAAAAASANARAIHTAVRTALWTLSAVAGGGGGSTTTPAPTPAPAQAPAPAPTGSSPSSSVLSSVESAGPTAGLDFSTTVATPSSSRPIYSSIWTSSLVLVAIALFLGLIAVSPRCVGSLRGNRQQPGGGDATTTTTTTTAAPTPRRKLRDLDPSMKLLVLTTLGVLLLVQAVGAMDAYVQTHQLRESTEEYFQSLSRTRLLGMSHSHLFGYMICYGLFASVFVRTSVAETTKRFVVSALCWAGPFDVLSWWGIRELSGRFEWLSAMTGTVSVSLSLFIAGVAVREMLFSRAEQPLHRPSLERQQQQQHHHHHQPQEQGEGS